MLAWFLKYHAVLCKHISARQTRAAARSLEHTRVLANAKIPPRAVCGPDSAITEPLLFRGSSSRQPRQKAPTKLCKTPIKSQSPEVLPSGLSGAATRIRTGDLILTKDVLYQLSHSSVSQEYFLVTQTIIAKNFAFVNMFLRLFLGIFFFCPKLFEKPLRP